jgi:hypothetical protein
MPGYRVWVAVVAILTGGPVRSLLAVPDYWDPRLNQVCGLYRQDKAPGVPAGQGYWRLTRGEFEDESQSGFNHHIYYKCLDVNGNPIENQKVWASWNYTTETGWSWQLTKGAVDGYWGNFPMYANCPAGACGWPYNAYVDEAGSPRGYVGVSDKVWGMGMHNPSGTGCGAHVNFRLTWRWTIKSGTPPAISRDPTSLNPSTTQGSNPPAQTFTVWNSGGETLSFSLSTNQPAYMSFSSTGGTSNGPSDVKTITVTYTVASLPAGTYNATITISDTNASNNPQTIPVTLTVASGGTNGTISGTVKDTSNHPLSGALVQTLTGGYSGTTDTDGSFALSGVAAGTYTLQASRGGYVAVQQQGVQVTDGLTTTVNFSLAPQPPFGSLLNRDFEGGAFNNPDVDHKTANSWRSFKTAGNPKWGVPWLGSGAHSPNYVQEFYEASYTAGVYQQVNGATPGGLYTGSVWVRGANVRFRVGVDPAGGTDAGSTGIQWCNEVVGTTSWQQISKQVTAATSTLTIFLKTANPDATNRYADFDDANLTEDSVPQSPTIYVSPARLEPAVTQGEDAISQTFTVVNAGSGTLSYSITGDAGWLSVDPASGTSTGEADTITVSYATANLSAGTYTAAITIHDAAATNDPQTIAVTLTVAERAAARVDFDGDGDVDLTDFAYFQLCFNGPNRPPGAAECSATDFDGDADVDLGDFAAFQACFNGPNRPPASSCSS